MADRTRSVNTASAPRTRAATSAGVRRNLFQGQLTRRPTASSSNSAETLRLADVDVDVLSDSEIVVRDKHGEIELGDPPVLMLEDDDEVPVDERHENEKERQRLAEAVKNHQINHNTTTREEPGELLAAIREVLKARVAALAEENWMFEPEDQPRG